MAWDLGHFNSFQLVSKGSLWCSALPIHFHLAQILKSVHMNQGDPANSRHLFTHSGMRSEILSFSQVPQWCQWTWSTDHIFSCKIGDTAPWIDVMFARLEEIRHSTAAKIISNYENLVYFHTFHFTTMSWCFARLFLFFPMPGMR